jgi:probable phosphoglycerate mutase
LLIRHGENNWTETHRLAGRTPGVYLNSCGKLQVQAIATRLAKIKLSAVYTSPLERTVETAEAITQYHNLKAIPIPEIAEVDYGEWMGKPIAELLQKSLWPVIQLYPSGAVFPEGETMYDMQARMIRTLNKLVQRHSGETIAIVGHGDLIKAAVAHYLGVHFDFFQRIVIDTASITTISVSRLGPRVRCVNDTSHSPSCP